MILTVSKWGILTIKNKTEKFPQFAWPLIYRLNCRASSTSRHKSESLVDRLQASMMGEELIIKTGELLFCVANILYQHLKCKKITVKIKSKWRPDMKIP